VVVMTKYQFEGLVEDAIIEDELFYPEIIFGNKKLEKEYDFVQEVHSSLENPTIAYYLVADRSSEYLSYIDEQWFPEYF